VVQNGLVLNLDASKFYSYPKSGNTWTDLSGNTNDGTLTNGPTYSSANGGYFNFDGVDDYCNLSKTPPINGNEVTFSVWNYGIVAKQSSIIWLAGSNGVRILQVHLPYVGPDFVYFDAGNGISTFDRIQKVPAANEYQGWHHWVFTKNAVDQTMYVYLDGSLWNSGTGKTLPLGTPDTTRLIGSNGTEYHRGYISNLQLYNRALTAGEITQNFNATKSRYGL
jgi:hypothetical protein